MDRTAEIEARYLPQGDVISMFVVPTESLPDGAAAFVENLEARAANGSEVALEPLGMGDWRLASVPEGELTVTYRVRFDQDRFNDWPGGQDEHGYVTPEGIFVRSASLFVLPGVDPRDGYSVESDLQQGWSVATPWTQTGAKAFHVDAIRDLVYNALFIGAIPHEEVSINDFSLRLVVGGDLSERRDLFLDLLRPVLASYVDTFGSIPDAPSYLIVLNPWRFSDGSAFANSISQVFNGPVTREGYPAWGHVMAHELLHYWNGSALSGPLETEWFKEGVTEYATAIHMVRSGVMDEDALLLRLATLYASYRASRQSTSGELSLSAAGRDKGTYRGLVYGGGSMAALCLDVKLRTLAPDSHGIDDVLAALFEEFGPERKSYLVRDVERAASVIAGTDMSGFFDRFVQGIDPLPVTEALGAFGFETRGTTNVSIVAIHAATDAQRTLRKSILQPR